MIFHTYRAAKKHSVLATLPLPVLPRPPAPPVTTEDRPNQGDRDRARAFNITPEEFVRRDNIVRQLWLDCQFKPGELVRPKNNEKYEKYGRLHIRGVYKTYHDFSVLASKEWPENDCPLIISASPDKGIDNNGLLLCAADSLARFNQFNNGGQC
jgi:hypothetical protein